jgi:hypothetical protein
MLLNRNISQEVEKLRLEKRNTIVEPSKGGGMSPRDQIIALLNKNHEVDPKFYQIYK